MQRRPYAKAGKSEALICPNAKCDNISSKLYIIENKIIESLKIWLENYNVNYEVKDNSNAENNRLIEKSIATAKKELEKENAKLDKIYDFWKTVFIAKMNL